MSTAQLTSGCASRMAVKKYCDEIRLLMIDASLNRRSTQHPPPPVQLLQLQLRADFRLVLCFAVEIQTTNRSGD